VSYNGTMNDEANKTRIWGYVNADDYNKIQQARQKERRNLSNFVSKAAVDRAEEVLDDENTTSN